MMFIGGMLVGIVLTVCTLVILSMGVDDDDSM